MDILIFAILLVASQNVFAHSDFNMTAGITPLSHDVHDLHMTIFYICVIIAVIVFGIMFYALLKHRKARGHEAAQFHESTKVEIAWTIIPFAILIGMAIPATEVLIEMDDTSDSHLSILVTGYQWKWEYEYLDENVSFFSNLSTPENQITNIMPKGEHYLREVDNPLVVPINKKIRFLFTAHDVIHSWWVPELGFKKDAVPGFINENWALIEAPGIYRGQCAELCGKFHGFMPIVVDARSEEDYQAWLKQTKEQAVKERELAAKKFTLAELMQRGEEVYKSHCSACHQESGAGVPPTFPALNGSKIVKGPIEKHLDVVIHGISGSAMQAFGAQLSEVDLAAVVTYERNAWDNKTGDMVQPSEVLTIKSKSVK